MTAPNPLSGTDEDFLPSDYQEMLASMRPSGENLWGAGTADVAASVLVPARKVKGALRYLIGYDAVTGPVGNQKLQRTNPQVHPRWTNCYVDSVAELEYVPSGKEDGSISKVVGKAKRRRFAVDLPASTQLQYYTNYRWAKLLVRFKPLEYPVYEDAGIDVGYSDISASNKEYLRNCWVETEGRAETLSIDTQYFFTEGDGLPGAGFPTKYSSPYLLPFKGEVGQIIVKPDVVVRWERVPATYVMSAGTSIPTKLLSILGRVNSATFLGYPRGTLLANAVKLTRKAWGLRESGEDLFEYDVEILCSFFDPPKGYKGNPPVRIDTIDPNTRGHNNCPWPGNDPRPLAAAPEFDQSAGKWFFVSLTGATDPSGNGVGCIYEYTDFAQAFNAADNT